MSRSFLFDGPLVNRDTPLTTAGAAAQIFRNRKFCCNQENTAALSLMLSI